MADSLDSGSSAHSGRAGSSPASRTKKIGYPKGYPIFLVWEVTRHEAERNGAPDKASFVGERTSSEMRETSRRARGRAIWSLRGRSPASRTKKIGYPKGYPIFLVWGVTRHEAERNWVPDKASFVGERTSSEMRETSSTTRPIAFAIGLIIILTKCNYLTIMR